MKRPSFQFYPADWLADMQLRLLPWSSKGLYMDLLCYCWREGWIPADSSAIAQLCGCHDLAIVEPCLKLFQSHPEDPSRLIHKRIQEEKNKQDEHKTERSQSGKKGAQSRWNKGKVKGDSSAIGSANSSAIKQPMAKNGSSSSTSSSNNTPYPQGGEQAAPPELAIFPNTTSDNAAPTPKAPPPPDPDTEILNAIWNGCPAKSRERSSKVNLQKAWRKLKPHEQPNLQQIHTALAAWRKSELWTKQGGQFAGGIHIWVAEQKFDHLPEPAPSSSFDHRGRLEMSEAQRMLANQ